MLEIKHSDYGIGPFSLNPSHTNTVQAILFPTFLKYNNAALIFTISVSMKASSQ